MNIVAINAGSSSVKYKLYDIQSGSNKSQSESLIAQGSEDCAGKNNIVKCAEAALSKCSKLGIDAIGYRIVHGGPTLFEPTRITPDVMGVMRSIKDLDPLHDPAELAIVESGLQKLPEMPAVAIFDTAFHHTLPEIAWRYALPRDLSDRLKVRRYGFHGISHRYVSEELLAKLGKKPDGTRLITCHLGSGASLCAVRDGNSIDTTMGMTPLAGLVMGTRSGDIDPGLVLYLLHVGKMSTEKLNDILNKESGLLGLSGISSDVRKIEAAARDGNSRAEMSLADFAYRASKYIGAYAVALEGLDAIAFSGGIGEHSPSMRSRICGKLALLGAKIDEAANSAATSLQAAEISAADSNVKIWVIPTDEEREIARETYNLLQNDS
jgi:acetate kinase